MKNFQHRILAYAQQNPAIVAVILNGSRANPNITPDPYQDFDVVFLVNDVTPFNDETQWYHFLGTPILEQLPHQMQLGKNPLDTTPPMPSYLMIFADGNRLDLTLMTAEQYLAQIPDSLSVVWLDKLGILSHISPSNDSDYWVKRPSQREFDEVCNEFFWVATYVAKGLARGQIIYAKDMMETVVRPMLLKLLEWKIGSNYDFKVNVGKSGKFLAHYLSVQEYNQMLATYADGNSENNWQALLQALQLFSQLQIDVAEALDFSVNIGEAENAFDYVHAMYAQ